MKENVHIWKCESAKTPNNVIVWKYENVEMASCVWRL